MIHCAFIAILLISLAACTGTSAERPLPTFVVPPSTLTGTRMDVEKALQFWVPAAGTITTGQIHRWTFSAAAGDQIRLRAISREATLTLDLKTESGSAVDAGSSIETTLVESGPYVVEVTALEGAGDYEIGLSYTDQPNPNEQLATPLPQLVGVPSPIPAYAQIGAFITSLENNMTIGGQMEADSPSHAYTFNGQQGQYVELEMRRVTGQIDPVLTLYDPEGVAIAIDDDSGGAQTALLRNVRLPEEGIYMVEANGSALPGGYSLRLLQYDAPAQPAVTLEAIRTPTPFPTYIVPSPAPATIGNRLENHVPVQAFLPPAGVAIYPIYAAEGEIITIGVTPFAGSGFLPQMEVVDPDGHVIGALKSSESPIAGDLLISPLLAQLEGTYQVYLSGENGTSGDYIIAYGSGSTRYEVMRGRARFDEFNAGSIDRRALRDVWTVELRAGDVITLNVNPGPSSQLDPIVEMVPVSDPNAIIAIDDNGGGGRSALIREVRINETGLYLIRIKASQAASIGDYTLIWRYVNVAPTSTPPAARAPLLSIQGDVADSSYRFYPFYGSTGQRIRVQVIGLDDFDPVAALIGPDGTELTLVDDGEHGDLNPTFFYTLPADGTYNVRVNGYIQGGTFELYVEMIF